METQRNADVLTNGLVSVFYREPMNGNLPAAAFVELLILFQCSTANR